jgi:5-methylcytosine-specific restriction endonuclease McrA
VLRSLTEGNRNAAKYRNYEALRVPDHLKSKRKTIPLKIRYQLLMQYKECKVCYGKDKLQIDHIDNNPSNNALTNLQVLCMQCNYGKK